MAPLTETEVAVIDAALAEEFAELLDLPASLLARYRERLRGLRSSAAGC